MDLRGILLILLEPKSLDGANSFNGTLCQVERRIVTRKSIGKISNKIDIKLKKTIDI